MPRWKKMLLEAMYLTLVIAGITAMLMTCSMGDSFRRVYHLNPTSFHSTDTP